ncbi:MAG: hypothetical protein WC477_02340 [Patescibacteria group bacterium]
MKQKEKEVAIGTCPYCLKEEKTLSSKEHVIPRGWFNHEEYPIVKPIIIYTCEDCNNSKSEDDSWMRAWLTSVAADKSKVAENIFRKKVVPSFTKGKFLPHFRELQNNVRLSDCLPSGLHLPHPVPQISVSDSSWSRIKTNINRIAKGLLYEKFKYILPDTHSVETFFANDPELELSEPLKKIFLAIDPNSWNKDNHPVFIYGIANDENRDMFICITAFYDRVAFISMVGPTEWIEDARKSASFN